MNNLLKKLKEPFPEDTSLQHNIRSVMSVGLFVTLFLYLLQPFGLNSYPENPIWICIGFGIVTIVAAIIYELIGMYVLRLQKDLPSWTLWKWIINAIFLVLFISICNYLYSNYLFGWEDFSWFRFQYTIYSTLAIGIFPIVFSGLMVQMNAYKRNQVQAKNIQASLIPTNTSKKLITLTSQNKNQVLKIAEDQLFYIEARQNYVSICYQKEGQITYELFRNTIKNISTQVTGTSIFRCHRSFLVNTTLIEAVAGNAQGLRLTLKEIADFEVPVSRKYIAALKALIS